MSGCAVTHLHGSTGGGSAAGGQVNLVASKDYGTCVQIRQL